MAGGIAILLIVLIVVVGGVVTFVLMTTGGAVEARRGGPHDDRLDERRNGRHPRPRHTRPSDPATENTEFIGSGAARGDRRVGHDDGPAS